MADAESDPEARTIAEVQASTRLLLESFRNKVADLKTCGPNIKELLRFGVDVPLAAKTATDFFGGNTVEYIAIDGTEAVDQQLDLIVFYVGAFAYEGVARFKPDVVEVTSPTPVKGSMSVSTAIPLSEEDATDVFGQRRESGVEVDTQRLPMALMHLAEYYLAYQDTSSPAPKILLLDRTLAGDVAHLVWSTSDYVRGKQSILEGLPTRNGRVSSFDLELVRMLMPNKELSQPAPRSQLLKFAAIQELFGGEALSVEELVERTGADPGWLDRLAGDLRKLDKQFDAFESTSPSFRLRKGASAYWERVLEAALTVTHHIFNPGGGHPLRVSKDDGEHWVTAEDLDFLVLVFIRAITRRAWEQKLLPIGFTKDSNAFELVNSVVPLLQWSGLLEAARSFPDFNSDKMLLQTNSVANAQEVPTPWHTIDIDASFRTMAPLRDAALGPGAARVIGAYENIIYPERTYVKTYIQLWSSDNNPSVRSHVFTFDRPVFPSYDHWDEITLFNKDGPVDCKVMPVLHLKRGSSLTNLVMAILAEMGREVIPEALGHNFPLFLADKKAKAILSETKEAYLGAVALEMAKSGLDQQVLFSRKFREYRSQIEGNRRG